MTARFLTFLCLSLLLAQPATAVDQYGYRLLERRDMPEKLFVQGFEISDGELYISTGRLRESRLVRYRLTDLSRTANRWLDRRLYGEGVTVLDDAIYQLTWKNRGMLIYDRTSLDVRGWHRLSGEGWGLTNNGTELIYGDGTEKLFFMNPQDGQITHTLSVTESGRPLVKLNELEWIDGRIWANIWHTDRVVVIDPDSGNVVASLDLSGLLPAKLRMGREEVLNGIARNPGDGTIWVTGKNWPWLFRIEPIPALSSPNREESLGNSR